MSHIGYYGGPVVGTDLSMSYINNYGGPVRKRVNISYRGTNRALDYEAGMPSVIIS